MYVPVTYVPDGPVTSALKRHVKGQRPKPKLGNLGPMLDENLTAARKRGCYLYHAADLRHLKGVDENPEIVDQGFLVLEKVLSDKGIAAPTTYERTDPYYPDMPRLIGWSAALALVMTLAIWAAVLLGQDDSIALMTTAIVACSLIGTALFLLIISRCVIRVRAPGTR